MSARLFVVVVAGFVLLLVSGVALGQTMPVRLYGGPASEQCHALVETEELGFCLAGWTRGFGPTGSSNVMVMKTDVQGTPVWTKVSVGLNDDEAYSMVRTMDSGYVVTGWTRSYGVGVPNKNIFVNKLDAAGNQVWSWVYGGMYDDEPYSIVQTSDGGFAITGFTRSFGPLPRPNFFVLRLDPTGMQVWFRVYWMQPSHMEDEAYSIVETPDYGFAVCGRAKTVNSALFNAFLLKLDMMGNFQWLRILGPANYSDEARSVAVDNSEHILVAGRTLAFGTAPGSFEDIFVAKFDLGGNLAWSWTYGWANGNEQVLDDRSLVATSDGGSAVCGPTTSVGPGIPNPNFLILKLDAAGTPTWTRSHPSPYDPGLLSDVPLPMLERSAGGYAVAGWTNSFAKLGGGDDWMLSTLDAGGNRPVCVERQAPEVLPCPWQQWRTADSFYCMEHDTMPLVSVCVKLDSVCFKPESVGVREGQRGVRGRGFGVRVQGRTIELTANVAGPVEMQMFSADGRNLGTLAKGWFETGTHHIELPKNLAQGAVIVKATHGTEVASAKVIVW